MGSNLPVFFTPFFLCNRRVALRWFVLAVPRMFLAFMMLKGLSRPAQRPLSGAAGQCLEEVEVAMGRRAHILRGDKFT